MGFLVYDNVYDTKRVGLFVHALFIMRLYQPGGKETAVSEEIHMNDTTPGEEEG